MDEIVTERLLLRPARAEDLGALHAILSDAEAMRYWSSLPHPDLETTRGWLDDMMGSPAEESFDFILELDGAAVGKAGCWRVPEVGYILHRDHWGQGLAREALQAIIPEVFARFGVPAITADVDPRNTASLGLLARLGFAETGRAARTWQVGGVWSDSVYLALPRPAEG